MLPEPDGHRHGVGAAHRDCFHRDFAVHHQCQVMALAGIALLDELHALRVANGCMYDRTMAAWAPVQRECQLGLDQCRQRLLPRSRPRDGARRRNLGAAGACANPSGVGSSFRGSPSSCEQFFHMRRHSG